MIKDGAESEMFRNRFFLMGIYRLCALSRKKAGAGDEINSPGGLEDGEGDG